MQKKKIDYSELTNGYEFPEVSFRVNTTLVAAYLRAVDDNTALFQDAKLVPPMALVALAMAALSKSISLPEGAIHVSQELEFLHIINPEDTITSHAKVSRKHKSGRFHLLTVDLNLRNQDSVKVLSGQTEFILPLLDDIGGK